MVSESSIGFWGIFHVCNSSKWCFPFVFINKICIHYFFKHKSQSCFLFLLVLKIFIFYCTCQCTVTLLLEVHVYCWKMMVTLNLNFVLYGQTYTAIFQYLLGNVCRVITSYWRFGLLCIYTVGH